VKIGYPSEQEELQILSHTTGTRQTKVEAIVSGEEIIQLQNLVREVTINDDLTAYAGKIVRATRPDTTTVDYIKEWVRWGAGPRAGQALILTAKARALLHGRYAVTEADINTMAYPVLRHRILMNFKADAQNVTSDMVTTQLIKAINR
jgi:MoxR-like ATPase